MKMPPGRVAFRAAQDEIRDHLPSGRETFPFEPECPSQPRIRLRRMDESIEEDSPVALRQDERFMPGDRPPRRFGQGRQAEIGQAAALQLGGTYHDLLRPAVHADAEASFARPRFVVSGGRASAGHLRSPIDRRQVTFMYVQWNNKSR